MESVIVLSDEIEIILYYSLKELVINVCLTFAYTGEPNDFYLTALFKLLDHVLDSKPSKPDRDHVDMGKLS